MKKKLGIILSLLVAGQLFAGGIDNKQNIGSRYMGEPTRNVAIDAADIATFNPAGVMFGDQGMRISVDLQYIIKTYEHTYKDAFQGGKEVNEKQTGPSPIPNLFATYKKGNWGLFGSLAANGGGGSVDYKDGNFTSYGLSAAFANGIKAGYVAAGYPENVVSVKFADDKVKAFSAYYTFTSGGSYQVNQQISVALGARYIYAKKNVEASAKFTPIVAGATQEVKSLELKYDEIAQGFGGVVSVDYLPLEALRLALRYESQVNLKFELDDKSNDNGTAILASLDKEDGSKSRHDLPGLLGFGVNYDLNEKLSLASSFTYYLEKDANWEGVEKKVSSNAHDLAFSAKYNFTEQIWATAGYMRTENYLSAADFTLAEQMSPSLDCNTFCAGGGYKINENMSVNISYMLNLYEDGTDNEKGVTYSKRNDIIACGFEYRM